MNPALHAGGPGLILARTNWLWQIAKLHCSSLAQASGLLVINFCMNLPIKDICPVFIYKKIIVKVSAILFVDFNLLWFYSPGYHFLSAVTKVLVVIYDMTSSTDR